MIRGPLRRIVSRTSILVTRGAAVALVLECGHRERRAASNEPKEFARCGECPIGPRWPRRKAA